jgi:hypothetical protein
MTRISPQVPRSSLPEYAHPPIVAATLGVFFRHPRAIFETGLKEYQERLGPEWLGEWEEVAADAAVPSADFGLTTSGRQLKNVLSDRAVRVDALHFAFTWLGTADARYPRYENLRDGFVAAWDLWAEQNHLSTADLCKWGVRYLNQIPQGTVWQTPADWSFFRLRPVADGLAERMTSARWVLQTRELPEGLAVDWTAASGPGSLEPPCLWIGLTACGEAGDLLDGMDLGRAMIVQTFSELMSPAANAYWGLRRREP